MFENLGAYRNLNFRNEIMRSISIQDYVSAENTCLEWIERENMQQFKNFRTLEEAFRMMVHILKIRKQDSSLFEMLSELISEGIWSDNN